MKILLFLQIMWSTWTWAQAQTGTVEILVNGIDTKKGGEVAAGLFTEENFPIVGKNKTGVVAAVKAASMELQINNVPAGVYGVAVFQDVDRNKQLKTNFVGLPQEPIGFSNDARIRFGPPSFADARIEVVAGQKTSLTITLR